MDGVVQATNAGICKIHCYTGEIEEFYRAAENVTTWGKQYGYFDHLSQLLFLKGILHIKKLERTSDPTFKEDLLNQISLSFFTALFNALKHNIYFLDFLIHDIIEILNSPGTLAMAGKDSFRRIIKDLQDHWRKGFIGNDRLAVVESQERYPEYVDSTHKKMLLEHLQNFQISEI